MANNHVISIERAAKLSVDSGRVEITFTQPEQRHYFAPFDIAALVLTHPCIQLSGAVIKELAAAGAVILHVGDTFMPLALTRPLAINQDGAKRPHLQAKYLNTPTSQLWWQQLVQSKILGQASVLAHIDVEKAQKLQYAATQVTAGDVTNVEASAAKLYWEVYFSHLNTAVNAREKQGAADPANACLNYAYAIVRAITARALASAGLCLNFGVGHCRQDNPFNLVEDFMEPFRFMADRAVLTIPLEELDGLTPCVKKHLIAQILQSTLVLDGKEYRLFQALDFVVNSFCISLEDPRRKLFLPNMSAKRGAAPKPPKFQHILYDS